MCVSRTSPTCSVPTKYAPAEPATDSDSSTADVRRLLSRKSRRMPSTTTGTNGRPPCTAIGTVDELASPASHNVAGTVGTGCGLTAPMGGVVAEIPAASGGCTGGGGNGVTVGLAGSSDCIAEGEMMMLD